MRKFGLGSVKSFDEFEGGKLKCKSSKMQRRKSQFKNGWHDVGCVMRILKACL